jgi:hypothetical protein
MGDYNDLLKSDLVTLAEERNLDASGTKADIIARLVADDDAHDDVEVDLDEEIETDDLPSLDASSSPDPTPAPVQPEPQPVADESDGDPTPVARESGAWDKLGRDVYDTFKDETKELWAEGKEDRAWLLSVSQRIAKQKYLAARAESNSIRNMHEVNLKHLYTQIEGETARKKMHFVKGGDSIFLKIVMTTIKTLAGALVTAVI